MKARHMTLRSRKAWTGRLFILPFTLGFLFFFLQPLVQSFYFSFTELSITGKGFKAPWIGLDNYIYAFVKDPDFVVALTNTVRDMVLDVPVILVYSLFIATILNQRFRGRSLARSVFFMPVVITSGIIIFILKQDILSEAIRGGNAQTVYIFQSSGLLDILYQTDLPPWLITGFTILVNRIFDLLWKSGVQILLFLAALQSIPDPLYEASKIEGATAWESFWKVTFPMISPLILVNITYTIIDSFTDYNNALMRMVVNMGFEQLRYAYSSALAWVFFAIVFAILGLVTLVVSRGVFYYTD